VSEADKAAIGISGLLGDNVVMPTIRRGSIDSGNHDTETKLVRSNSLQESKTRCQKDAISTVAEESIEEEIIGGSDGDEDTIYEEILEDDSIASSSMSC
jgi:hypothetical protein